MTQSKFKTFEEFWPFYVMEHSKPATRWFHFAGTAAGAAIAAVGIGTGMYWLVPVGIVAGYGPAWISHFFIEKNKPASFKQPLYSFMGDWKMLACMVTGRMGAEIKKAEKLYPKGAQAEAVIEMA